MIPDQPAFDRSTQPTDDMHPVPTPQDYQFGTPEDLAVEDFLSPEFEHLWKSTGETNRKVFERIFRPVPNDMIRNWQEYDTYIKPNAGINTGHVANKDLTLRQVKEELAKVRGHLVDMPLHFCEVSPNIALPFRSFYLGMIS